MLISSQFFGDAYLGRSYLGHSHRVKFSTFSDNHVSKWNNLRLVLLIKVLLIKEKACSERFDVSKIQPELVPMLVRVPDLVGTHLDTVLESITFGQI